MPWNSTWPDGTKSVKNNETPGQQNTSYIETTLNLDHFWNQGTNEDGRHRQVQMPKMATDATLATGMDGVIFLKDIAGRTEGFFRNAANTYQFIPAFKSGSVSVTSTSSYATVTNVPNGVYGHIYMFTNTNSQDMAMGFFKAAGNVVHCYTVTTVFASQSTARANLKFGNGAQASGLNIRVRRDQGPSSTYAFRIVYWGI